MHAYIQATKLCVQVKTRRQAGLNRYLLGRSPCSWLHIKELIDRCNVLRAKCTYTLVSERANVAEHTLTFTVFVHTLNYESTQNKLWTEVVYCLSCAVETGRYLLHLERNTICTLCTVCTAYIHFKYRLFTHCVQVFTVIYILRLGCFHFYVRFCELLTIMHYNVSFS
jgi:hypothetical protein